MVKDLEGTGVVEGMMDDLDEDSTVTGNQIINKLLTEDDLAVKSEIWNPIASSTIDVLGKNFDKVLMQKVTAGDLKQLILDWQEWYRKNMISYKRQSRKEVVQAVTQARPDEQDQFARTLLDRALGSQK